VRKEPSFFIEAENKFLPSGNTSLDSLKETFTLCCTKESSQDHQLYISTLRYNSVDKVHSDTSGTVDVFFRTFAKSPWTVVINDPSQL